MNATLSMTERRVGALVAEGCTDRMIATRLLLSVQAVEWSVAKLCRILGVESRAQLAAVLAELSGD
jgi:DNA-binding NarL/FixJ family response regulator